MPSRTTMEPFRPFTGGWVRTTHDALILFRAAKDGLIPSMPRRLSDLEKVQLVRSGAIFVFEEKRSGIKRWTDAREWSPSRILHNFLIYRELDPNRADRTSKGTSHANGSSPASSKVNMRRPSKGDENEELIRELVGSLREHDDFQRNGLMKKTITITFDANTPYARAHHIISYYNPQDVLDGRLLPVSRLPLFAGCEPSHEWLDPTHFRFPPRVALDSYGYRRYLGEGEDELSPAHRMPLPLPLPLPVAAPVVGTAPLPPPITASALSGAHAHALGGPVRSPTSAHDSPRYRPYARPSPPSSAGTSTSSTTPTQAQAQAPAPLVYPPSSSSADGEPAPSLSPSSSSSDLSLASPTEYGPVPPSYYASPYYHHHAHAHAYAGPELSFPAAAADPSAAPRPSPYYPANTFWHPSEDVKPSPHMLAYYGYAPVYPHAHGHAQQQGDERQEQHEHHHHHHHHQPAVVEEEGALIEAGVEA